METVDIVLSAKSLHTMPFLRTSCVACSLSILDALCILWLQDTAKINAGRAPHSFFARRATQVDAGAAKVKVVTELTTPPLPPLHVTQVIRHAIEGSYKYCSV